MGKKLGNNMRLMVPVGDPGVYTAPLGQGNLTINRNASTVDTSSKEDFPYGTSAPGNKQLSLTQAIIPNLPDTAYTALKTADSTPGATLVVQVWDVSIDDDDAKIMFECEMYVSFGNTDANQNAAASTSLTFTAAAAPTKDLL